MKMCEFVFVMFWKWRLVLIWSWYLGIGRSLVRMLRLSVGCLSKIWSFEEMLMSWKLSDFVNLVVWRSGLLNWFNNMKRMSGRFYCCEFMLSSLVLFCVSIWMSLICFFLFMKRKFVIIFVCLIGLMDFVGMVKVGSRLLKELFCFMINE